jgi:hypothetical protein
MDGVCGHSWRDSPRLDSEFKHRVLRMSVCLSIQVVPGLSPSATRVTRELKITDLEREAQSSTAQDWVPSLEDPEYVQSHIHRLLGGCRYGFSWMRNGALNGGFRPHFRLVFL